MNAPRPGGRATPARTHAPALRLHPSPALDEHEHDWYFDPRNGAPGDRHVVGTAVPPEEWPAWTDRPLVIALTDGGADASH